MLILILLTVDRGPPQPWALADSLLSLLTLLRPFRLPGVLPPSPLLPLKMPLSPKGQGWRPILKEMPHFLSRILISCGRTFIQLCLWYWNSPHLGLPSISAVPTLSHEPGTSVRMGPFVFMNLLFPRAYRRVQWRFSELSDIGPPSQIYVLTVWLISLLASSPSR